MMNAAYAVVIALAVQTVKVYQMELTGQVTVAAYQNIMMEMIVMTVQALQMVIAG